MFPAKQIRPWNVSALKRMVKFGLALFVGLGLFSILVQAQPKATLHVAVLDLGSAATGTRAAEALRNDLLDRSIVLIDQNLAMAAARGSGFQGSLNLSTEEARDIGAAIGCDFFVMGDAQTLARSPSSGANYFESYAAIFIISARTGRLVLWERPSEKRATAAAAEEALLRTLAGSDAAMRYRAAIVRAAATESNERTAAIESPAATIDVMSDDDQANSDTRAPRPYRRFKPPYPPAAAEAEIEATVDVLLDIDARGEIGKIEIARWAGYGLDQSVVDTVKHMHFFPAMREGNPIPMRVLLRYNFHRTPPDQSTANPTKQPPKIIIKPRP